MFGPDQLQELAPVDPPVSVIEFPVQTGFGVAVADTEAGIPTLSVIAEHPAMLVPQVLSAVTHTLPLTVPKFTVMAVVPCPEAIVAPVGTVQL